MPVDAATDGLKSEHVVVCFQIQGCFWGEKLIQGKGTGIYNLDRYLRSNGVPQSCEWNDLDTADAPLKLTGARGRGKLCFYRLPFMIFNGLFFLQL